MELNIEEVISYKTKDGAVFKKKEDAIKHNIYLIDNEKHAKLIQQTINLFKSDINRYKNVEYDEDYKFEENELETDFWEYNCNDLDDICISDFGHFVDLIEKLMKKYHLEKMIKLIKNKEK